MAKSKLMGIRKKEKGFLPMSKKWDNLGVPRDTMGGKKTKIDDKRLKIKI